MQLCKKFFRDRTPRCHDQSRQVCRGASVLKHCRFEYRSVAEFERSPAVVEDGATFEANALKKARTLADFSGLLTLADDSGLEVDALNGAPGIYSARYCGREGRRSENNRKLLRELTGVAEAKRTGAFCLCVGALCA